MIQHKRVAMMLVGGLLLAIPGLQAVVLPPVTVAVAPDDFTANGFGDIILGAQVSPFTEISPAVASTFTGIIKSAVFTDFFTHDLDFVYQYTALTGETIGKITAASYNPSIADGLFADPFGAGVGVDVGIRNDVGANAGLLAAGFVPSLGPNPPNTVDRSNGGSVVEFNFEGPFGIPAGSTSELLIVRTHSTTFTMGQGGVIDSRTADVNVWAPSPEPRLAGLAALGLFGLVAFFFRRRKVQATE